MLQAELGGGRYLTETEAAAGRSLYRAYVLLEKAGVVS